ncbi:hypothetical protein [Streptomyces mobaraensis]|uniref:Uncharacterized protein n=1 Tax=Streptomyces mobaraensis TaxID=35621 RepID=A0A5N5WBV9_STRMB|nr:hypothetical protein [Streptomyces mobaraensis]KAB7847823.1 hypothetical protein FRZ00_10815 [Streptomyces mobaraensis]
MGIKGRLGNVGGALTQAASAGKAAAERAAAAGREAAGRSATAGRTAADAGRDRLAAGGDWVMEALERLGAPDAPATRPWKVSLGTLIGSHPLVPAALAKPLRLLDRFGAVCVGPDSVGFDGEDIPWDKVVEIRMVGGYRSLTKDVIDGAFEGVRRVLIAVPGRDWVLDRVAEALTTLLFRRLRGADETGTVQDVLVPGEIVYRGALGRKKSCEASLYPLAFLLGSPAVVHGLLTTAEARGVAVVRPEGGIDVVELAVLRELEARAGGGPAKTLTTATTAP